jgi:hypothetical protein
VQQRREGDLLDVHVMAGESPFMGIARRPLCAQDDLQDAEQGSRLRAKPVLERLRSVEGAKERLDTEHHHRAGNVGDVATQAAAADRLDVGENTRSQQRILQHDVGDFATADALAVLSRLVEPADGLP